MSPRERRKRFFYSEFEAGLYDGTIEFVVPFYGQMHRIMCELAHLHHESLGNAKREYWILDIGSGSGAEAIRLCELIPNARIIALDICEPIHAAMKAAFNDHFNLPGIPVRSKIH